MKLEKIIDKYGTIMDSYWDELCDEYNVINSKFKLMSTSEMLMMKAKCLIDLGNGITPEIAVNTVINQFIIDDSIGNAGMQTINAPITNNIYKPFIYQTRTFMTYDRLYRDVIESNNDEQLMIDNIKLLLKHELGHAITYHHQYDNCETVNHFFQRLQQLKPHQIIDIQNYEAYCVNEKDYEKQMRVYYNMLDEKLANNAVGLTPDDFVDMYKRFNNKE